MFWLCILLEKPEITKTKCFLDFLNDHGTRELDLLQNSKGDLEERYISLKTILEDEANLNNTKKGNVTTFASAEPSTLGIRESFDLFPKNSHSSTSISEKNGNHDDSVTFLSSNNEYLDAMDFLFEPFLLEFVDVP